MLWRLAKAVLFRFDPERIHSFAVVFLKFLGKLPRIENGEKKLPISKGRTVFGLEFRSRLGLAAGFDKDAEAVLGLERLGFGHVEIGTVTPRPQPGNPRPRLFREPSTESLLNRMGFNNLGCAHAAAQLARVREKLPQGFRVGVNIGKNKDTPLEEAERDYAAAVEPFSGLADYIVINVSSPNTPGVRSLQAPDALRRIFDAVAGQVYRWKAAVPVLLKFAPEIDGRDLQDLMRGLESSGVGGWVLTNTLQATDPNGQQGGWSGGRLTEISRRRLLEAREATRLPIISVGGILSEQEALERCAMGADLIQIYSGWIFRGPMFIGRAVKKLEGAGF